MAITLGAELQQTIRNLEKIRDSQKPPHEDVLAKLDALYEQQIDLIDAAIQKTTPEYINAAVSMSEAAKKTQEVIDGLTKLDKAIQKVADAVGKVTVLLAAVT
jgi:dihydropteroate synthase